MNLQSTPSDLYLFWLDETAILSKVYKPDDFELHQYTRSSL